MVDIFRGNLHILLRFAPLWYTSAITMTPTEKAQPVVYQARVELEGIKPPIWRRIQVPGSLTLGEFHDVIQIVMGWRDSHLHRFTINQQLYGLSDEEESCDENEPPLQDERTVRLVEVLPTVPTVFTYEYDYGDEWRHTIEVQKTVSPQPGTYYPTCLAGNRACPPEDVGGIAGYEELLGILADRRHPEHKTTRTWVGEDYDPGRFDRVTVNQFLYIPHMRYGVTKCD